MGIKKEKIYKKLYVTNDYEATTDRQMKHFVICGDKNWDYFFDKRVESKKYFVEAENVKLIEFFAQSALVKYLEKLPKTKLLNFSYDKNFIAVLELIN